MKIVLRHIEYLLSCHDCVIIPGLGAFIASRHPALYDDERHIYLPPYRTYTFNSDLTESDGLLISSVSRGLEIDYASASRLIGDCVQTIISILHNQGEFTFMHVGRLELNDSGIISFVPHVDELLNPLQYWLPKLNLGASNDDCLGKKEIHDDYLTDIVRSHRFSDYFRAAAGAVAAIFIALIVSTPVAVENTYLASTVPPITAPQRVTLPESQFLNESPDSEFVAKDFGDEENSQEALCQEEKITEADVDGDTLNTLHMSDSDDYVVVIASLSNLVDAEKYIEEMNTKHHLKVSYVQSGSNYRIYAATGATRHEAYNESQKEQFSALFADAWVARR
ncbi:MAG: hypothetical protein J1F20_00465 [Muribaculaceae bacterium]|nr:hypothetical protein [Muribaculaceae bacterium]